MKKQELIAKTKIAAMQIVRNPICSKHYRKCIMRKIAALNFNDDVSIKDVENTLQDIRLIAEKMKRESA